MSTLIPPARFGTFGWLCLLVAIALAAPHVAAAQQAAPEAGAQEKKIKPPPPPEKISLRTADGRTVAITYYGSNAGKDAAAVILVHALGGNRADFDRLALQLQAARCAVVAVDLRGHGESGELGHEPTGDDYIGMVRGDLEAVKSFLLARNNAGELNIERLGVVGVEMGATIAINWAALDWSWPLLATGKQGQDVKALALVSPEWALKGVRITDAMAQPSVQKELAVLIVTGSGSPRLSQEARRLYKALARHHADPSGKLDKQTLFLRTPATSLQGTKLLLEKGMNVEQMIVEFVDLRLVQPNFPWSQRQSPLKK